MDDYGPTIEEEIRSNDELSPTQKKLMIQQAKLDFYGAALIMVLCFLLMGTLAILIKGWLLAVVDGVIFWGTGITYTVLKDKKSIVERALNEENAIQQKIRSKKKRGKS